MARRGVSLVEMAVVVAIIGMLILMLLPAVLGATDASRRINCQNNQKQVALGLLNYHQEFEAFPPGIAPFGAGGRAWAEVSWGVVLMPYIEHTQLWGSFAPAAPMEAAENRTCRVTFVSTFACPSGVTPLDRTTPMAPSGPGLPKGFTIARASFVGSFGTGDPLGPDRGDGMFPRGMPIRIEDVLDGASTTMLTGERSPDAGPATWAGVAGPSGAAWVLGSTGGESGPNVRPLRPTGFSSRHAGGMYASFGDGSVRWIRDGIAAPVYASLATRRGGEIVEAEE